MRIDQSGLSDKTIVSPHALFGEVVLSPDFGGLNQVKNKILADSKKIKIQQCNQLERKNYDVLIKKKKDGINLRRLVRQQKIEMIKRRFMAKLKLNNINSKPIEFQPYSQTESVLFLDKQGIQIYDWLQKLISGLTIVTILICIFINTTSMAFPQIKHNFIIHFFQIFSFSCFVFQLFSSLVFIKTVNGKKIYTIRQISKHYLNDRFVIDLSYLVVLIIQMLSDAGVFRLIILLKLSSCFQRLQKIENSLINTFYKQQYWGLAKVFLFNFFCAHIICISLILMSQLDTEKNWMIQYGIQNADWPEQYIWGYYWGTTIMLTVGFGDITPANHKEAICVIFIQTLSCLALAYNINCVGNLINNIKSQDIQKNKQIKTFKILSNRNNLTEDLEIKIHNYIEQSTNIKKKFNFQEEYNFVSTLPRQLKADFLKQSNKKIFQNLIFFKNLTEKTLLSFAEVIQMKICHPAQIIKKRNEIAGIMILKEGKIGLTTKLNGSDFNSLTIQTVEIQDGENPFLLSLDFLSNDRAIYDIKSQQYSILYYLDLDKTFECIKAGQLDYEHFCFLKDKARNFQTDFEVFFCSNCNLNHSKFQCPKLHYCPLKKHVIDKFLHCYHRSKSSRRPFIRKKKIYNCFQELENNFDLFLIKQKSLKKFASYKKSKRLKQKKKSISQYLNFLNCLADVKVIGQIKQNSQIVEMESSADSSLEQKLQFKILANYLKEELSNIISNECGVWLIESDEVKNYKFYFPSCNAVHLENLNRKNLPNSIFTD